MKITRTKTLSQKLLGLGLVLGISSSMVVPGEAEARLIFSTQEGVNSDAYHIDNDDSSTTTADLYFGGPLSDAFIQYDKIEDSFKFSKDVDLNGNELQNFIIENEVEGNMPACDATNTGQMYYDTTADEIRFCADSIDNPGTFAWISNQDNSILANMINADVAGLGLIQDVDGSMRVNVDDSTLEIDTDVVKIKEEGVTTLEIEDETIVHEDIATGAVRSDEILDDTIVQADRAVHTVVEELIPEFTNMTIWADPAAPNQHVGSMEADYDVNGDRAYYKWATNKDEIDNSLHSYTIVLQYALPDNFWAWSATDQIELDIRTHTVNNTDNEIDVTMVDTDNTIISFSSGGTDLVSDVADTWETEIISFDPNQLSADWDPGKTIVLRFKMSSRADVVGATITQHPVYIGKLKFNYDVK